MLWLRFIFFSANLLFLTHAFAQTLVEEAKAPLSEESLLDGVFFETIKIISPSRKIFILTNTNQQLGPGDFVSLAIGNKLAARALVAKTHNGSAGLKMLKIYSLSQWGKLHRGVEVQVVKGDDSQFGRKVSEGKPIETNEDAPKIKTEDDLFNSKGISESDFEGGEIDEDSKRHIKPDNVVSLGLSFANYKDVEGSETRGNQFSGSWAYQFSDNWFGEFFYGRTFLKDYPAKQAETVVNNVVARLKYNFKAPLYCFVMPYIGFRSQTYSSPTAGQGPASQRDAELSLVEKLKKNEPAFGVTLLRRLVPGWFVKADIGTDVINGGVAIEF